MMASAIKTEGGVGTLLTRIADRGGAMRSDYTGFPPAKVFLPLRARGLVTLIRSGLPRSRSSMWHLTAKGWAAIGRPPATAEA